MSYWIQRGGVALVSFLLALLGLDLFLQAAEIQSPMENQVVEGVGLMYVPDFRFSRFSEGFFLGRTNSYGCLGQGAPREREGGEIRILILGDSFPLGHTVFERHHFGRTLETVIEESTGRPAVVLNFARADFAIASLYQHYVDFASRWDHDLALFFGDQTDLDPVRQASGAFYPYAVLEGDSLRYDYSFVESGKARAYARYEPILNRTVLPRFVFEFLKVVDRGDLPRLLLDKLVEARPHDVTPPSLIGETNPLPPLTRAVLERVAGEPRVAFVLSGPAQEDWVSTIRQLGIPVLDLNGVFEKLQSEGVDPYYWEVTGERGHWNHVAHVAIGEALGRDVVEILDSGSTGVHGGTGRGPNPSVRTP